MSALSIVTPDHVPTVFEQIRHHESEAERLDAVIEAAAGDRDNHRWEAARLISIELKTTTVRALATEIGKGKSHVSDMGKVAVRHGGQGEAWGGDPDTWNPPTERSFDYYYQQVKKPKPEPKPDPEPDPEPDEEPDELPEPDPEQVLRMRAIELVRKAEEAVYALLDLEESKPSVREDAQSYLRRIHSSIDKRMEEW